MGMALIATDTQFFPTSDATTLRMIAPFISERGYLKIRSSNRSILDPQAGNGAILSFLHERFDVDKSDLHAIEIQQDLRFILNGKGFRAIATDWLEYSEPTKFGMIVSNPPFAQGAKHALKCFDHLDDKGQLAVLLNSQTLLNPHTKERRLLLTRLAALHGIDASRYMVGGINGHVHTDAFKPGHTHDDLLKELETVGAIEWFGQCFLEAERTTDVDVVCIRATAPETPKKSFSWADGDYQQADDVETPSFGANPLASTSAIKVLVLKYNAAVCAVKARAEATEELQFYLKGINSTPYGYRFRDDSVEGFNRKIDFQEELKILKATFWKSVFSKTDLGNRLGSKAVDDFEKFAIEQQRLEFCERNIVELMTILLGSIDEVMNGLVADVFDKMTGYDEQNSKFTKGWKTNSSAKIKKGKVILPGVVLYQSKYGDDWSIYSRWESFLDDLDKAMAWSTGTDPNAVSGSGVSLRRTIGKRCFDCSSAYGPKPHYSDWLETKFFLVKMHKSGTVHLKFKCANQARDFQKKAAEGRKWIGRD